MVARCGAPRRRRPARLAAALLLCSCSSPGRAPEAAAPGGAGSGWVELRLADRDIPADPAGAASGVPPPCRLELALDGRPVLSEALRPQGAAPPYSLDSRFLLRTRAGPYLAAVVYSGCRTVGRQLDSMAAEIPISVAGGRVTRMLFDGARLEAHPPRPPDPGDPELR